MIQNIPTGLIFVIFLAGHVELSEEAELKDCVMQQESSFCYYCDSKYDPSCSDPFKYSHYYLLNEIYLTGCMGCCTKITYPAETDGSRRIVRSCTESLSHGFNFSLESNCNSLEPSGHRVCLCTSELCNSSTKVSPPIIVGICILISFFIFI